MRSYLIIYFFDLFIFAYIHAFSKKNYKNKIKKTTKIVPFNCKKIIQINIQFFGSQIKHSGKASLVRKLTLSLAGRITSAHVTGWQRTFIFSSSKKLK